MNNFCSLSSKLCLSCPATCDKMCCPLFDRSSTIILKLSASVPDCLEAVMLADVSCSIVMHWPYFSSNASNSMMNLASESLFSHAVLFTRFHLSPTALSFSNVSRFFEGVSWTIFLPFSLKVLTNSFWVCISVCKDYKKPKYKKLCQHHKLCFSG